MTEGARRQVAWAVSAVVLAASLSAVVMLNARASGRASDEGVGADFRFGFRLRESAKASGVDFVHHHLEELVEGGVDELGLEVVGAEGAERPRHGRTPSAEVGGTIARGA